MRATLRATCGFCICLLAIAGMRAPAQQATPRPGAAALTTLAAPGTAPAGRPPRLSLAEAVARAEKYSPQFQAAATAVKLAHEAQVQARAAMKPAFGYSMSYLNTQGNGISPVGRFVTNDGVHVYNAYAVARQEMPGSFFLNAGPKLAAYGKAFADAQQRIARRGLRVVVTQNYYALLVAQRGYATAQQSLTTARHFLKISQELEKGGEVAHADVIRFQLQVAQAQRAQEEAQLGLSTARLNLAVLLFPRANENFTLIDDLAQPPPLPPLSAAAALARRRNPALQAALAAYHQSGEQVTMAKAAFLPSLSVEFDYGIQANALALHSVNTTVLKPRIAQPNLGYFATYTLNLPLFDWGARWSKLHAAEDIQQLERVNLGYAQRSVLAGFYNDYNTAAVAWNELASLRLSARLAAHNLRLVTMQYRAGEAQVLQVLDAENSLALAQNSQAAGEARYRDALANLQTLTGRF